MIKKLLGKAIASGVAGITTTVIGSAIADSLETAVERKTGNNAKTLPANPNNQRIPSYSTAPRVRHHSGMHTPGKMLCTGIDSRDFVGKSYKEVINTLIGAGFRNISAREIRVFNNDFNGRNAFGRVKSVIIGGSNDYSGEDVFPASSYVVVEFHVFRNSPHIYIPELEELKKNPPPQPVVTGPRFCDYCENEIDSSCAVCPHCGAFLK